MIKGGGAALTREKIVAAQSQPLRLHRRRIQAGGRAGPLSGAGGSDPHGDAAAACGSSPRWAARRVCDCKDGLPLVTDNGQHILDVTGLQIADPLRFESEVNQWPGVVTVGVFAHQKAAVCLLGTAGGVKTLRVLIRTGCRPDCPAAAAGAGAALRAAAGAAGGAQPAPAAAGRPPAALRAAGGSPPAAARSSGSRRRPGTATHSTSEKPLSCCPPMVRNGQRGSARQPLAAPRCPRWWSLSSR